MFGSAQAGDDQGAGLQLGRDDGLAPTVAAGQGDGDAAGRALGAAMRRNLAASGKAAEEARKVLFGQRAR